MKSFRPKNDADEPPTSGRNGSRDFHGEQRRNDTHASTTDAEAWLFRKSAGKEARLCFMGHLLMENRSGLVVAAQLTQAAGWAEREAAGRLFEDLPGRHRITVGADRGSRPSRWWKFEWGLRWPSVMRPWVEVVVWGRAPRPA